MTGLEWRWGGCGIQGISIAGYAADSGLGAEIVAVCDVYEKHLDRGRERLNCPEAHSR